MRLDDALADLGDVGTDAAGRRLGQLPSGPSGGQGVDDVEPLATLREQVIPPGRTPVAPAAQRVEYGHHELRAPLLAAPIHPQLGCDQGVPTGDRPGTCVIALVDCSLTQRTAPATTSPGSLLVVMVRRRIERATSGLVSSGGSDQAEHPPVAI
jgi:hypothetical protein